MLHDTPPLRIEATPGTSRRLMVSFSSVGNRRGDWPEKEFVGSVSQEGRNHVICIADKSRSWMNGPGIARAIQDVLSDYALAHGIRQIMAVGSSMGAYAALVLGRLMPLDRIIAFTPQFSVHPDIMPQETRWLWFRRNIKDWPHPDMAELPAGKTAIYMFHGDTDRERLHWARFPHASNLEHYIFRGSDHGFVGNLKRRGKLHTIVAAAIHGRPGRMDKLMDQLGAAPRALVATH